MRKPIFTSEFGTISACNSRAAPTMIKFVVPRFFVEGLSLFAGKPKAGKSWLLLHAALAVARGGYTLGDILCIEGDVLYCALEDNPRRLKRRVKKLHGSDRWPERLKFECGMPRLNDGGVEFIRKWIESNPEPRLVVIDTLAKVRDSKGAQETSYEADYRSVSELKALADEKGIAIVLVHHQRKMTAEDPLDTVSGTTGLTGAVDSVLVLVRDGGGPPKKRPYTDETTFRRALRVFMMRLTKADPSGPKWSQAPEWTWTASST